MLSALLGAIFSATAVYLTLHAAPGRQRRTAAAAAFAAYEAGAVAYGRVQDGRAASRAARLGHVPAGWLPPRSRDVAPPLLPPPASQGGGGRLFGGIGGEDVGVASARLLQPPRDGGADGGGSGRGDGGGGTLWAQRTVAVPRAVVDPPRGLRGVTWHSLTGLGPPPLRVSPVEGVVAGVLPEVADLKAGIVHVYVLKGASGLFVAGSGAGGGEGGGGGAGGVGRGGVAGGTSLVERLATALGLWGVGDATAANALAAAITASRCGGLGAAAGGGGGVSLPVVDGHLAMGGGRQLWMVTGGGKGSAGPRLVVTLHGERW
ncbi:hypothetical protein I4F81_006642 [Pyropia yezoensis]|uniref:Uncharacterized protein n=1 Tax=Pyropia yezoensis TaxID=2788 RepID=A0ACC3C1Q6_PYRYE|nr:hypothetical protein I4F81_006642 [Neopyropia yezoensis]